MTYGATLAKHLQSFQLPVETAAWVELARDRLHWRQSIQPGRFRDKAEEKENDKTTTKSSTSSKSTTKSGPKILDFQRYLVSLDVKQYFACYNQLVDMRNCYAKAHALFIKNQKRLSDPRGDGGDGPDRGVMSMF